MHCGRPWRASTLAASAPAGVQQRLIEGSQVTLRSLDGRRQIDPSSIVDALLPFLAGFLFIMATVSSSGYLLQALTAEKENRTAEVMITSLTPLQLVGGKSVGLMAVSLSQLAIWLGVAIAAIAVAGRYVPELRGLHVSPDLIVIILLYFLPAYALIAGLMTAIGAIMPDQQQGQQIAGLLNMMFFVPYFLAAILFANPNGPLAVALTLFPTTAFTAISVRWGMTTIPTWQLAASWVILVVSAVVLRGFRGADFPGGDADLRPAAGRAQHPGGARRQGQLRSKRCALSGWSSYTSSRARRASALSG